MSEYTNVEKPFLQKLNEIGWTVYDKGYTASDNPGDTFRDSLEEVFLKREFLKKLGELNPWITEEQKQYCYNRISSVDGALVEANRKVYDYMQKGITLPGKNEVTGVSNPTARLIDFDRIDGNDQNSYIALNQFKILTPGGTKSSIIPDIVCFINGMPIVVIECKDIDVPEPMSEAFDQINRYSNQRTEDDWFAMQDDITEGVERLFHTNMFNVITRGEEAKCGTICAPFDFFLNWRDIFPEEYIGDNFEIEPSERQAVMIKGMFNHSILLDIFQNFTIYDSTKGPTVKKICRYQQYRAVGKMIQRLENGTDWRSRSGVIWHTQGSGKSLTMVFLVRKMRTMLKLKDYKVLMVVDRTDLEDQLTDTAKFTGEIRTLKGRRKPLNVIDSREELVMLEEDTPDLRIVMIHKFGENKEYSLDSLIKSGVVPKFERFPVINDSDKILILIDEAHRSQGGEMSDNLFFAFPNAARIGFTGTPLITPRHKATTCERFGQEAGHFIDTYKMSDSVRDHATVDIKYIGRKSADEIPDRDAFDKAFESTFQNCTEKEKTEIQKRYINMVAFLEGKERVIKNATDMLDHYLTEILPNGFKAQVVAASIRAAVRYSIAFNMLISRKIKEEEAKPKEEQSPNLDKLRILKARAVVSSQGNNEEGIIRKARNLAVDDDAIENFKKKYDKNKPLTGIGILCVCDRLLTGFDAPIEQVMYLDKCLSEHNLMQAITRVNRTAKNKTHGIVVDYFGITKNLHKALGIYDSKEEKVAEEDLKEFDTYFKAIEKEIPELELRYNKILQFFEDNGIANIRKFVEQKTDALEEANIIEQIIIKAEPPKFRAEFDSYIHLFYDIFDLLFNDIETKSKYYIPAKRIYYIVHLIKWHYHDTILDLKWASPKIRLLLDKYIQSKNVVETIPEVDIFSPDFPTIINQKYKSAQTKASAMAHQLRYRIIIKLKGKDNSLYEKFIKRIEDIMNNYANNWEDAIEQLERLRQEAANPDNNVVDIRIAPIYHLICDFAGLDINQKHDPMLELTAKVLGVLQEYINRNNIWQKATDIREMKGKFGRIIILSKNTELKNRREELVTKLVETIKNNDQMIRDYVNR